MKQILSASVFPIPFSVQRCSGSALSMSSKHSNPWARIVDENFFPIPGIDIKIFLKGRASFGAFEDFSSLFLHFIFLTKGLKNLLFKSRGLSGGSDICWNK